ncbi:MAG: hypothetical protein AAF958_00780 [Planctomycetota bacterium]
MPLIFQNGLPLFVGGSPAWSIECCCPPKNCSFFLYVYRAEFDTDSLDEGWPDPPPTLQGMLPGLVASGRAQQVGFYVNDCISAAGVVEVYWYMAVCEGEPNSDVVASDINVALNRATDEEVFGFQATDADYLGTLDDLIRIGNSGYTNNPGPGECSGVVDFGYTPIEDATLNCCEF